jgi:predicted negative regulator of RcsB-dependent stress response
LVLMALWAASLVLLSRQSTRLAASMDETFATCIQAARDRDRMTVTAASALLTIAQMRGDEQEISEAAAMLREAEASAADSKVALDRAASRLDAGARP